MDLLSILTLVIGNSAFIIPLFLWNRAESRADIRHMDAKLDEHRKEVSGLIQAIHDEMKDFQMAMMQESKDFHSRLCVIEERNRGK